MKRKIHLLPIAIFLMTLFYLVVVRSRPLAPGTLSNSFAIAATFVIGLCFLLGPLARMKPHFVAYLRFRKPLGLWGYLFAAIHAAAALLIAFGTITDPENLISIISGIIAFAIFTLMAATSTGKAIAKLGFHKWKKLQQTGYIAFFLVLVHFAIIEKGAFISRQIGQLLFGFVLLILLLRILVILAGRKQAYEHEDFHELHGIEKHEESEDTT
ncbi:MAG: ferric reductase-like transmembrane domain-containing protein [Candidatus Aenigmarchaeota archaeon]|nr:ferric reductase-like transmembrane domain-containing protein [Candidatus Aenigmarchaeota archaeon]